MVCLPPPPPDKMVQKIVQKMLQEMLQKIVQGSNDLVHMLPYIFFVI